MRKEERRKMKTRENNTKYSAKREDHFSERVCWFY